MGAAEMGDNFPFFSGNVPEVGCHKKKGGAHLSAPRRLCRQLATLFQVYSSPQSFSLRLTLNWKIYQVSVCPMLCHSGFPSSIPKASVTIKYQVSVLMKI